MRVTHGYGLLSWASGCLICLSFLATSAAGSPSRTLTADPSDGRYRVVYQGEYKFEQSWQSRPGFGVPSLKEEQWQESAIVTVKNGVSTVVPLPLKLEGSLVATNDQAPGEHPADHEDCLYTPWRDHNGSQQDKLNVLSASAPTIEAYGLQVYHPVMTVKAAIPSTSSLQVAQSGTTTGAYKTALDCVNPKNPGTSVLMSDQNDSGGVLTNFTAEKQAEYESAAAPSARFPLSTLPMTIHFDANATAHQLENARGSETLQRSVKSTITVERLKP